jgi:hypothetical protein
MHNPLETPAAGSSRLIADRLRELPTEVQPPFNWQEFRRRSRHRLPGARGRLDWSHAIAAGIVVMVVGGLAVWSRVGLVNHGVSGAISAAAPVSSGASVSKSDLDPTVAAAVAADGAAGEGASVGALPEAGPQPSSSDRALVASGKLQIATADLQAASEAVKAAREALEAGDGQPTPERAKAIETWLASLPREPVVVRVGTRSAVAGLEDRIAQVDDLLTFDGSEGTHPDRIVALRRERARLVGSLAQVRYAEFVAAASP